MISIVANQLKEKKVLQTCQCWLIALISYVIGLLINEKKKFLTQNFFLILIYLRNKVEISLDLNWDKQFSFFNITVDPSQSSSNYWHSSYWKHERATNTYKFNYQVLQNVLYLPSSLDTKWYIIPLVCIISSSVIQYKAVETCV